MLPAPTNAGPGSFRQAIEDANADPSIRRVVFVAGIEYEEDNDFAGGGDIIATLTNIKIKGNG
ncbi:MAG: hypothetical protein ACRENP_19475 [Longimicrobiales bacterium]